MSWQNIRQEILERDNFICQECHTKTEKLDVHHIIPRKQGGQDTFRNLISLCYKCHQTVECQYAEPLLFSGNGIRFKVNPIISGDKIFFIVPKRYHDRVKKMTDILEISIMKEITKKGVSK